MRWWVDSSGNKHFISLYDNRGTSKSKIALSNLRRARKLFFKDTVILQSLLPNPEFFTKVPNLKNRTSNEIAEYIVRSFIIRMLIHVAEGNVFLWPGKDNIRILLKYKPLDEIKYLFDKGKITDIDLHKSGFKYPIFVIDFGNINKKDWRIHVPRSIQLIANENLENGMTLVKYIKNGGDIHFNGFNSGDARDIPRSGYINIEEQY